jgi:hypothetical protein
MACSISTTVAAGFALQSTAARPARCGVAIDVPLILAKPPPTFADTTSTPGPTVSGTLGFTGRLNSWFEEKSATCPELSMAPTESTLS